MTLDESRRDFRVGRKVGRTIYLNDELVGLMDTPELALLVAQALRKYALIDELAEVLLELAIAGPDDVDQVTQRAHAVLAKFAHVRKEPR